MSEETAGFGEEIKKQQAVSNPAEAVVMCFEDSAEKTDNIERCRNKGCGFNDKELCTASGTECFGYIDSGRV